MPQKSLHSWRNSLAQQAQAEPSPSRRKFLQYACGLIATPIAAPVLMGWPQAASAGAQLEEPLADSVRSALRFAIASSAPPEPVFSSDRARAGYENWLAVTSALLEKRISNERERLEFLQTVWYESKRAGLETSLVLGLIEVESAFRKYAISSVGARGYMQIMPFWVRVIGDGQAHKLFHMQTNLRFGNVILRHYLDIEKGNLFMALGRYNGSRGRSTYPNSVFAAQKKWQFLEPKLL